MNHIEYKRAGDADVEILVNQRMLFSRELGGAIPALLKWCCETRMQTTLQRRSVKAISPGTL